jgi:hypothetical protein
MPAMNVLLKGSGVIDHVILNPGWGVNRDSVIVGSATEMIFSDIERPRIGVASIDLLNIAPQDNGNIDFRVNVLWDSDLLVRVSIAMIQ